MPRLPIPHSDAGTWGDVLNEYLEVEHNSDGTLKASGSLAAKADDSSVVHNTGAETIDGAKTFSSAPVVPDGSFSQSKVTNLTTDLASKEDSSNKGIAGGYAGLDGGGRVPVTQLGGTGADNTTFLRGDGTWSTGPVGPQGPQGDAGLDLYPTKDTASIPAGSATVTTSSGTLFTADPDRIWIEIGNESTGDTVYINLGSGAAELGKGIVVPPLTSRRIDNYTGQGTAIATASCSVTIVAL